MSENQTANAILLDLKDRVTEIKKDHGERNAKFVEMEKKVESMERLLAERGGPTFTTGTDLPGSEKNFQFHRLIMAMKKDSWTAAGAEHEREVLEQSAKQLGMDTDFVTKAASLGNDVNLGNLVPNVVQNELVPMLQAQQVLPALGVLNMPNLSGSPIQIARETADGEAYWVGENSAITASDAETDMINLQPKKVAALAYLSNDLLKAGGQGAETYTRGRLTRKINNKKESTFFGGTGTGAQPFGMKNMTGRQETASIGTPTIQDLQGIVDRLRRVNVPVSGAQWAFSPATLAAFEQIAAADNTHRQGTPIFTMGDPTKGMPGRILGIPYQVSTNITDGDLFLAYWPWMLQADWGGLDLAISNESGNTFRDDQTAVRVTQLVDFNSLQPSALVYAPGVTVPALP